MKIYDAEEASRLNAEKWQIDLLDLNPNYPFWGPHEDYMWKKEGWESPIHRDGWGNFDMNLDDLNEVVHFYFQVGRSSMSCPTCGGPEGGNGVHPDGQWISESFYPFSSPFRERTADDERAIAILRSFGGADHRPIHGHGSFPYEETLKKYGPEFRTFCEEMSRGDGFWCDKITQDELDALVEHKRITDQTLDEVNNANAPHSRGMGHDEINRYILVETRCNRMGVPRTCDSCGGRGIVFTEPSAHVNLVLWLIHPRKGASRGVEIKNIHKHDLPDVYKFLRKARDRNAERFSKIP
jgi:hypothetical protein